MLLNLVLCGGNKCHGDCVRAFRHEARWYCAMRTLEDSATLEDSSIEKIKAHVADRIFTTGGIIFICLVLLLICTLSWYLARRRRLDYIKWTKVRPVPEKAKRQNKSIQASFPSPTCQPANSSTANTVAMNDYASVSKMSIVGTAEYANSQGNNGIDQSEHKPIVKTATELEKQQTRPPAACIMNQNFHDAQLTGYTRTTEVEDSSHLIGRNIQPSNCIDRIAAPVVVRPSPRHHVPTAGNHIDAAVIPQGGVYPPDVWRVRGSGVRESAILDSCRPATTSTYHHRLHNQQQYHEPVSARIVSNRFVDGAATAKWPLSAPPTMDPSQPGCQPPRQQYHEVIRYTPSCGVVPRYANMNHDNYAIVDHCGGCPCPRYAAGAVQINGPAPAVFTVSPLLPVRFGYGPADGRGGLQQAQAADLAAVTNHPLRMLY